MIRHRSIVKETLARYLAGAQAAHQKYLSYSSLTASSSLQKYTTKLFRVP
jgi:hypothetical protein